MKYFFIGIAGAGMSAIAQYLSGKGHTIMGSDRVFLKPEGQDSKSKLEMLGIQCFAQGERTPDLDTDFVVVSTAIEDSVPEFKFAKDNGINTIHRSDLLAEICDSCFTIAVSGTSGKSTTTAMIFDILSKCGKSPSLITGAGLISLQRKGLIGNAFVGESDYLVIETDESDGTIIKYKPQIGLILNIDRDHKEISELIPLFETFKGHCKSQVIVNLDNSRSACLSNGGSDFSCVSPTAKNFATDFQQDISGIRFRSGSQEYRLSAIGRHNMENALAAISVARFLGIADSESAAALSSYEGIYRRNRIIYNSGNIMLMDDFAHNPAKISAAISACQAISERVIAWFQPHGFAPSRLMKDELIEKLTALLRPQDIMLFSKIYYAGGTADQSISAGEFADALAANGKFSLYIEDRDNLCPYLMQEKRSGDIILLMGARDPSLADFAASVAEEFSK